VKKDRLLFLSKLLVFSLALGYLWFSRWQVQYPYWIGFLAEPFFRLVGVKRWWMALVLEHFTNLVPYVSLVLASPDLLKNWKRSLIALTEGVTVLILGHLLLSWGVYYVHAHHGLSQTAYKYMIPMYIVNDALPLVLWLAFFPHLPSRLFSLQLSKLIPRKKTANPA
jgi:hypothetical protein